MTPHPFARQGFGCRQRRAVPSTLGGVRWKGSRGARPARSRGQPGAAGRRGTHATALGDSHPQRQGPWARRRTAADGAGNAAVLFCLLQYCCSASSLTTPSFCLVSYNAIDLFALSLKPPSFCLVSHNAVACPSLSAHPSRLALPHPLGCLPADYENAARRHAARDYRRAGQRGNVRGALGRLS